MHGDPLNAFAIIAASNRGLSELFDGEAAAAFCDCVALVNPLN